jgi:hypothetical protein
MRCGVGQNTFSAPLRFPSLALLPIFSGIDLIEQKLLYDWGEEKKVTTGTNTWAKSGQTYANLVIFVVTSLHLPASTEEADKLSDEDR